MNILNNFPGPTEIVALLSNYGLHGQALTICGYFKLCKISVLENLASQCARLDHQEQDKKWNWPNGTLTNGMLSLIVISLLFHTYNVRISENACSSK